MAALMILGEIGMKDHKYEPIVRDILTQEKEKNRLEPERIDYFLNRLTPLITNTANAQK